MNAMLNITANEHKTTIAKAEYYAKKQDYNRVKTYQNWAENEIDKMQLRLEWAEDAREKAELRMKWARDAYERAYDD